MGGYFSSQSKPADIVPTGKDRVLIPVDQSQQAETAFEWYFGHLHKPGNQVKILHCLAQPHITDSVAVHPYNEQELSKKLRALEEHGKQVVAKYEQKLKEKGADGSVLMELGPRPEEMVVEAVAENNISYVVMGSRGYGVVRRTILGSVSHYVICHSDVPVCVLPKERGTWF